jgi:hypothetical protein
MFAVFATFMSAQLGGIHARWSDRKNPSVNTARYNLILILRVAHIPAIFLRSSERFKALVETEHLSQSHTALPSIAMAQSMSLRDRQVGK